MTVLEAIEHVVSALVEIGAYNETGLSPERVKTELFREQQRILKTYTLLSQDTITISSIADTNEYELSDTLNITNVRSVTYNNELIMFATDMAGIRSLSSRSSGVPSHYCYVKPYLYLGVTPSESDIDIVVECNSIPENDDDDMVIPDEWCWVAIYEVINHHVGKSKMRFTYGGPSLVDEYRTNLKNAKMQAMETYRSDSGGTVNRIIKVDIPDEF